MASKRDQIKLSDAEVAEFLTAERVMNVASNGRDGWPHVTALWFVMRGTEPWCWTYRKSQKVKNLERDDRTTLLFESGHEYAELKGVMLKTRGAISKSLEGMAGNGAKETISSDLVRVWGHTAYDMGTVSMTGSDGKTQVSHYLVVLRRGLKEWNISSLAVVPEMSGSMNH